MSAETLGLMLTREGIITRSQLYDALRLQRQNERLLGTCLLSLGYISAERLLQILSEQLQVPVLPPGSLKWAAEDAVKRIPRDLALRLRVVPYSYDGQMLGVAVADGRVLEHLHDVAKVSHSAVGAYIALEMEIESALGKLYGHSEVAGALAGRADLLPGRPRPMRIESASEVPSQDFADALGLESVPSAEPVVLQRRKGDGEPAPPSVVPTPAPPPAAAPMAADQISSSPPRSDLSSVTSLPSSALPTPGPIPVPQAAVVMPATKPKPPAALGAAVERVGLYKAVEEIYAANSPEEIAAYVAAAVLNYFERVLVLTLKARQLSIVAYGGAEPTRAAIALEAVPEVISGLGRRNIAYGNAEDDPRSIELCDMFGLDEAATALIAPIDSESQLRLLVYADNGDRTELYEDLHDIELLLKEAETALNMLAKR